jgi:E3 ubiquitin-protein ligase RNFT1
MEPLDRSGTGGTTRRYGLPFSASNIIQAPLVALLEYSGILRVRPIQRREPDPQSNSPTRIGPDSSSPEVSIRIVGGGDQEALLRDHVSVDSIEVNDSRNGGEVSEAGGNALSGSSSPGLNSPVGSSGSSSTGSDVEGSLAGNATGDRTYQRYDIHHVARWIEQILPCSLLLLVVFIRQHLQGIVLFSLAFFFCD